MPWPASSTKMRWAAPSRLDRRVAPGDRLEAIGTRCQRHLAHDVHHPVQRPGILHGDQRIAFEHQVGHAHDHGEDVVIERRRHRLEEVLPELVRSAQAEAGAHVETRRVHDVDDAALLDAQHDALAPRVIENGVVNHLPVTASSGS